MNYEMTGRLHKVIEQQVFGIGFTKREFVLLVEDGDSLHSHLALLR